MKKTGFIRRMLALLAAFIVCFASMPIVPIEAAGTENAELQKNAAEDDGADDDGDGTDDDGDGADDDGAGNADDDAESDDEGDDETTEYALDVIYDAMSGSIVVRELSSEAETEVTGTDTESGKNYVMEAGKKYEIEITAETGYEIDTIDVNETNQFDVYLEQYTYTIESAAEEIALSVSFKVATNMIRVNMNTEQGDATVTECSSGNEVTADMDEQGNLCYTVVRGSSYEIKVCAKEGYELVSVPEGFVKAEDEECCTYTINPVAGDSEYNLSFQEILNPIAVEAEGNGTVIYTAENGEEKEFICEDASAYIQGTQDIVYGKDAVFTLLPDNGYYVSEVKINGSDIKIDDAQVTLNEDGSSVYTFARVTSEQSISVVFSKIEKQQLSIQEDETADEMLARGNIEFLFSKETDRNNVQQGEGESTYILTHHQKVTVQVKEDETSGYEILDHNVFVTAYDITSSADGIMNQYVLRRTKGAWEGSVVRYCTGYEWNFVIDNTAPEVSVSGDSFVWVSGKESDVVIAGKVSDDCTGIKKIVWFTTQKNVTSEEEEIVAETTNVAEVQNGAYTITIGTAPTADTNYYIYAVDEACNIAETQVEYHVDTKGPEVTVELEKTTKWWQRVFFNKEEITVILTADDADGSGVDTVTLFVNGEEYCTEKYRENGKNIFVVTLKKGREHTFTAIATDKVGNKTGEPECGGTVYYDNDLPIMKFTAGDGAYEKNEIIYSAADIVMQLQVEDKDSGLAKVEIEIKGQPITADANGKAIDIDYTSFDTQTFRDEFVLNTALGQPDVNGKYVITVRVYDVAENEAVQYFTVYKDETAPEITGLQVTGANAAGEEIVAEGSGTVGTTSSEIYGYYAANQLLIDASMTDGVYGSGVETLSYILKNADGTVRKSETVVLNGKETMAITIPADFKGSIYVKAKDYVGNEMSDYATVDDMIAESQEQFDNTAGIVMTAPGTTSKDIDGNNLYAGNITIPVVVTDTYAGIRSIEWSIRAPQDSNANQSGTIVVDNAGNSSENNWRVTSFDRNLATCVEGAIIINANSNAIVVDVKMTNRAGYVTTQSMTVSIDKTTPVVEISFDNEQGDATYTEYFAESRTAAITVKERNFDEAGVSLDISNTEGNIPALSGWTATGSADETVYTAELVFDADGDYAVSMQFTDMAGNKATTFDTQEFTIDKTMPEIEVSFDNEQSINGNYFAAERTATVRVTEHNFDADRIEIVGTATDNGNAITFPVTSHWSDEGDEHTATITFERDGQYSFEVTGGDMAGNEADMVEVEEYYIDLTDPVIEILGVEDMSANNGSVQPTVQIIDTNYSQSDVEIQLVGANRGTVIPEGTFVASENGQTFRFSDFAKEQEVDDIYTLTATETDMAGNTVTESITFSVNRFGSVYTLDSGLEEITGSYIKKAVDIVLTETNVDALDENSIEVVLSANGTPHTLEKGTDYTLTKSGGNGSWNQYEYNLHKENFAGDGTYKVTIYSVDAAGNINETVNEEKKAEIEFGVDGTAPVIVPLNIEDGGNYDTEELTASFSVQDNLVLDNVKITLNGEPIECQNQGDTYEFVIPEASKRQSVVVLAQDAAGNALACEVTELLVSTNGFVRWYNNKPLFAGTLAGTGVVAGGAGAFWGLRRKNYIRIKRK
ncbi:MAG: Ig-like domain-containing protein [Roseburia sp.]|nr:Ig-like domain-containing protein [Roseburia sp.]